MLTFLDHAQVAVFALLFPAVGFVLYRHTASGSARLDHSPRLPRYVSTMGAQWLLAGSALTLWAVFERPWSDLGLALDPGTGLVIAVGVALAAIGLLFEQLRRVRRASAEHLSDLRRQLRSLEPLLPRNRRELRAFDALSLTAGFVEELLWRGYLIWYLQQLAPLWLAAGGSVLLFGLAHAYQGPAAAAKTGAVAAVLTALYLISGTLWPSIALHAAIDMLQGRTAYEVLRKRGELVV